MGSTTRIATQSVYLVEKDDERYEKAQSVNGANKDTDLL
jgi:hypothetical protein